MQMGLYLHRRDVGVWRVVSEDSDYLSTWLTVIHGFGDFDNFDQPTCGEMKVAVDHPKTCRKLQEIELLGSSQGIPLEEWNDRPIQITPLPNTVPVHMLFVVVVSLIDVDVANSKELHEHVEDLDALRALRHRKLMSHLKTRFVTPPIVSMRLPDKVD